MSAAEDATPPPPPTEAAEAAGPEAAAEGEVEAEEEEGEEEGEDEDEDEEDPWMIGDEYAGDVPLMLSKYNVKLTQGAGVSTECRIATPSSARTAARI